MNRRGLRRIFLYHIYLHTHHYTTIFDQAAQPTALKIEIMYLSRDKKKFYFRLMISRRDISR